VSTEWPSGAVELCGPQRPLNGRFPPKADIPLLVGNESGRNGRFGA
jgi:hypothetical protein